MATVQSHVSDTLVLAASQETQRGMLAEWRGDRVEAARHLLAAGHLELVLAEDYDQAGDSKDAMRSRLSAASCFWRGGEISKARAVFDETRAGFPERSDEIAELIAELERDFPESCPNGETHTTP